MYLLKVTALMTPLVLLNSCLAFKPSTTKSGKNLFESFYVGEAGTQYFIKPLLFQSESTNEELLVDLTFKYKDEIKDSVTVNFSLESETIYKSLDQIKLTNQSVLIESNRVDRLFNERVKDEYVSRFTTKFSLAETKAMFENSNWTFDITHQNQSIEYRPHKKASKAITKLQDHLFVLF